MNPLEDSLPPVATLEGFYPSLQFDAEDGEIPQEIRTGYAGRAKLDQSLLEEIERIQKLLTERIANLETVKKRTDDKYHVSSSLVSTSEDLETELKECKDDIETNAPRLYRDLTNLEHSLSQKTCLEAEEKWVHSLEKLCIITKDEFDHFYNPYSQSIQNLQEAYTKVKDLDAEHQKVAEAAKKSYNQLLSISGWDHRLRSLFRISLYNAGVKLGIYNGFGKDPVPPKRTSPIPSGELDTDESLVAEIDIRVAIHLQPLSSDIAALSRTWKGISSTLSTIAEDAKQPNEHVEKRFQELCRKINAALEASFPLEERVTQQIAEKATVELPDPFAQLVQDMGLMSIASLRECHEKYLDRLDSLEKKFANLQAHWADGTLKATSTKIRSALANWKNQNPESAEEADDELRS